MIKVRLIGYCSMHTVVVKRMSGAPVSREMYCVSLLTLLIFSTTCNRKKQLMSAHWIIRILVGITNREKVTPQFAYIICVVQCSQSLSSTKHICLTRRSFYTTKSSFMRVCMVGVVCCLPWARHEEVRPLLWWQFPVHQIQASYNRCIYLGQHVRENILDWTKNVCNLCNHY